MNKFTLFHPFFIVKFSHSLWPGLSPNLVSSYIALNLFGHSQRNVFISQPIQNTGSHFFINRLSVLQPGSRTQFCKNLRKKRKKKSIFQIRCIFLQFVSLSNMSLVAHWFGHVEFWMFIIVFFTGPIEKIKASTVKSRAVACLG